MLIWKKRKSGKKLKSRTINISKKKRDTNFLNYRSIIEATKWESIYEKPVLISEFGAGALYGFHGDELTRWSEEYQDEVYKRTVEMFDKV
jgi:hypothetical protein